MPYKYISKKEEEDKHDKGIVITETKELEKPKTLTEEESQLETVKEQHDKFFDEDDEIIEVNFD